MITTIVMSSIFGLLAIWLICFYVVADFLSDLGDFDLSIEDLEDDCFKGLRLLRWEK